MKYLNHSLQPLGWLSMKARSSAGGHPDRIFYASVLGQIVNEEVKKAADPKRSRVDGFSFSQESPLVRLVDRKLAKSKNYDAEGMSVDLLMWFDLTLGTAENLERFVSNHRDKLSALLTPGSFDRVWIFDRWAKRIIWSQAKS